MKILEKDTNLEMFIKSITTIIEDTDDSVAVVHRELDIPIIEAILDSLCCNDNYEIDESISSGLVEGDIQNHNCIIIDNRGYIDFINTTQFDISDFGNTIKVFNTSSIMDEDSAYKSESFQDEAILNRCIESEPCDMQRILEKLSSIESLLKSKDEIIEELINSR